MALCSRCGNSFVTGTGALSRRDNEKEICNDCGYKEAVEDIEKTFGIRKGA